MIYDFKNTSDWKCIGTGSERHCYVKKSDKSICYKISNKNKAKQSKREISYIYYLKSKNIPFTHIPETYGIIKEKKFIGIIQEVIYDADDCISLNLKEHIKRFCNNKEEKKKLLHCLNTLKEYLIQYNIIPCDLVLSNILIQNKNNHWKAIIIDGLGTTEIIPYTNYIPYFGRIKINRKWDKFIKNRLTPLLSEL